MLITSNNEKELPDAFLRRCFFHYIKFPDPETMRSIVEVHFPNLKGRLVSEALKVFYDVREVPGIKKKPSTSELLDWIKLLLNEDISPETLRESDPQEADPAAARRAAQERAGRAPVRAPGVPRANARDSGAAMINEAPLARFAPLAGGLVKPIYADYSFGNIPDTIEFLLTGQAGRGPLLPPDCFGGSYPQPSEDRAGVRRLASAGSSGASTGTASAPPAASPSRAR